MQWHTTRIVSLDNALGLLLKVVTVVMFSNPKDLGRNLGASYVWITPCSLHLSFVVGSVSCTMFSSIPLVQRNLRTDRGIGLSPDGGSCIGI